MNTGESRHKDERRFDKRDYHNTMGGGALRPISQTLLEGEILPSFLGYVRKSGLTKPGCTTRLDTSMYSIV
eukprot:179221-Pyramimonas_sp.AAC.1